MHLRTLLILVLVVGALAAAVMWQGQREELEFDTGPAPLFEGAQSRRIDRIRVDNLERSVQMLIERRGDEGWMITDPIDARAEGALVQSLIDALTTQEAFPVADPDPAKLGLAPPRAVVEFEEEVDGTRIPRRLELGANDLDGHFVIVRAGDAVVRTPRTFESILDRPVDEWRSRSIVRGLRPFSIVEMHRRGKASFPGGDAPVTLDLDVVSDDGWHATSPWRARLDPAGIGMLLQAACTLRAYDFVDDAPVGLDVYGLDDPDLTIELIDGSGRREVLKFAPLNGEDWYVLASSDPSVYSLSLETMLALTVPPELMVERDLVRLVHERVGRVALTADGRELLLERQSGAWTMTVRGPGSEGSGATPADPARVEELLSELERARILALLPDVSFEPGPQGAVSILLEHDGRTLGGALGAQHDLAGGGRGVLFQRAGDSLVSLVDEALVELARSPPGNFENRQLVLVSELELARIELAHGGAEASYALNERGRWGPLGTEVEARSFAILVDRLLAIRSAEPDGESGDLTDPVQVTLVRKSGPSVRYELGRRSDEFDTYRDGERRALVKAGLHAALAALFATE